MLTGYADGLLKYNSGAKKSSHLQIKEKIMELTIKGTPEEIKKALQAIGISKECENTEHEKNIMSPY